MIRIMKKNTICFVSAALMTLCIIGCEKERQARTGETDIQFGLHMTDATKALLESDDLLTEGTQVKVYGFAEEDLAGHLSDGTTPASPTKLNAGQTIQYGTDGWSFINNNSELYQWKNQQNHKFFGWLTKDAKSNIVADTFFGTGFTFDSSSNILSIPARTLGINTANFDFAYSEIVNRSASEADFSTVDLSLEHLFSSFSLSARNYSGNQITITNIEIHGLQDGKSATVDYSGTAADVTYSAGSVTNHTLLSSSLVLSAADNSGDRYANVVGTPSNTETCFLVWPQTDLVYGGTKDGDGRPTPAAADVNEPYIKIEYTQAGNSFSACVDIPSDEGGVWTSGTRYGMELAFRDKEIDLTFKAAQWDKMEPVIDYDGGVSVTQPLRLATEFVNNCTLSADGKTAYFKPGTPIILEFAIGSPENATWLVGEKLDWDAFDVYNYPDGARKSPDENVKAEGVVDGNLVQIAIDPPTKDLQKTEFSLELTFSVRLNNGEMVSIEPDVIFGEGCPTKFVYIKM